MEGQTVSGTSSVVNPRTDRAMTYLNSNLGAIAVPTDRIDNQHLHLCIVSKIHHHIENDLSFPNTPVRE
eukprot:scaffold26888_cov77-Attheya_sp.AAC.2